MRQAESFYDSWHFTSYHGGYADEAAGYSDDFEGDHFFVGGSAYFFIG